MDGLLNINKHPGLTSHDVVARVRRAAGQKRVGHAGTLDPDAAGVLLVCLGNATRIIEYLMDWHKQYRADATFGVETDTEDSSGSIVREVDCSHLTSEKLEEVLPRFTGSILQVPPMVSALHHEGKRLYELARSGQVVERTARPVEIYRLHLIDFTPGIHPTALLDVECSKGTYIRTLCADIGQALDCGGHMSSLVRTAVGRFTVDDAVSLDEVELKASQGHLEDIIHPMSNILLDMPAVLLDAPHVALVRNGVVLTLTGRPGVPEAGAVVRIVDTEGCLVAIGSIVESVSGELMLKPDKVFACS